MADYHSLLMRAVANLPSGGTPATRESAIYSRARKALLEQLKGLRPPLQENEIAREMKALDAAIAQIEARYGSQEAALSSARSTPAAPPAGKPAPVTPPAAAQREPPALRPFRGFPAWTEQHRSASTSSARHDPPTAPATKPTAPASGTVNKWPEPIAAQVAATEKPPPNRGASAPLRPPAAATATAKSTAVFGTLKKSPQPVAAHVATAEKVPPNRGASTRETTSLKVFVSYSHRDERMRNRLGAHLVALVHRGLISIWQDREIDAAEDWERKINQEIHAADIVLVLISPSFLESKYCQRELLNALERRNQGKTLVVPIILKPCDWEDVFNRPDFSIQALPRDNRPVAGSTWKNHDVAYREIARELRKVVERKLTTPG